MIRCEGHPAVNLKTPILTSLRPAGPKKALRTKSQYFPRLREVSAGERSRTFTGLRPTDFESAASAIPPLRRFVCQSSGLADAVQDERTATPLRTSKPRRE